LKKATGPLLARISPDVAADPDLALLACEGVKRADEVCRALHRTGCTESQTTRTFSRGAVAALNTAALHQRESVLLAMDAMRLDEWAGFAQVDFRRWAPARLFDGWGRAVDRGWGTFRRPGTVNGVMTDFEQFVATHVDDLLRTTYLIVWDERKTSSRTAC
jgi:hypothetical protein